MQKQLQVSCGRNLRIEMEFDEQEILEPVSPTGQYLKSSALSLTILAVLESEVPIDDSQTMALLKDVFLPINPRFSSIMVGEKNGMKKWKRVEVKLNDHVNVPIFPPGMSPEFYGQCLSDYLSNISVDNLPQSQPLWEIHIIKYPTRNAAGNLIFKLHHSLGDGFSLVGALISCLQRVDNPSIPLTFPSRQSRSKPNHDNNNIFTTVPKVLTTFINSLVDFGWSLLKSSVIEDDTTPIRSNNSGVEFRPINITTISFSLHQIKQIKEKLKVTINDVIMGVIFFGTRLYMEEESYESKKAHSTALVLLNTRNIDGYKSVKEMVKPDAEMPWGNHFAFLHVTLPILNVAESSNPLNFILQAHQVIKRKRNSLDVYLTARLLEALRKLRGPEVASRYIHSTLKNSSMAVSNLIGPGEQMALANHPIKGLYFSVVGAPQSLSLTMISYVGKLRIAIGVEKGFIDPQKFKSCIENSFEVILKAAEDFPSPKNS